MEQEKRSNENFPLEGRGILLTKQNLHRKVKNVNEGCMRCGSSSESDKHIFFECQESKEVWRQLSHLHVPASCKFSSFKECWLEIMQMDEKKDAEFIAIVLWLIWNSRNEQPFEGTVRGSRSILNYSQNLLTQFQALQKSQEISINYQAKLRPDSKWKPPVEGFLKLNTDAAFKNGEAGIGVVIRNHNGEIEAVFLEQVSHCCSAEHAEAMAIFKALQFAKEVDITHAELETDALTVVSKVNNTLEDLSVTGHVLEEIRALSKTFPALKINFVSRKANFPAHMASKIALCAKNRCVFYSNFPMPIEQAVISDHDQ